MTVNFKSLTEIENNLSKQCRLLIVTKNRNINDIDNLISSGYRLFGENKVQEAETKFYGQLNNHLSKIELHLIGHLQSKKTRKALEIFDTIQSIDREKIVENISKEIKNNPKIKTKNFFIQINIGQEIQKSGVPVKLSKDFYYYALNMGLNIEGFMCIPPANIDSSKFFQQMLDIKNDINEKLQLSMGMSMDYKNAIKFQSNMIRVGSLIFT